MRNRTWWMAGVLGLIGVSVVGAAERPNVLMIAIDDLNDWVEPLEGHPLAKTPAMARLAARGTTFLNAHCQAPLCNPSRTSLLTGRRPTTTGVYALDSWFRADPRFKDLVTLPQHFMRNGYHVASAGKIFHDAYPPPADRTDGNEMSEWGVRGGFRPMPTEKFVETPDNIRLMDWGVFPERDEDCFDYDLTSWGVEFLKRAPEEKPWMLCVGIRHPHVPCFAPQRWFDLYPDDDTLLPMIRPDDRADIPRFAWYLHWKLPEPRLDWLQRSGQWRPLTRAYLASVSYADAMVGRLTETLAETGHAEDTIVVLWSDHGWHLGEKEISGKNTLWEDGTRVPLIFAGPGIVQGATSLEPAELLDVYPTLAALCGLPEEEGLEGESLVPQLQDAAAPKKQPAITSQGPDNHSVRTRHWRYIRYADGSEELYRHPEDPHEWRNLAGNSQYDAVKEELAKSLPKHAAPPLGPGTVRLLQRIDGVDYWQGEPIDPKAEIPQK